MKYFLGAVGLLAFAVLLWLGQGPTEPSKEGTPSSSLDNSSEAEAVSPAAPNEPFVERRSVEALTLPLRVITGRSGRTLTPMPGLKVELGTRSSPYGNAKNRKLAEGTTDENAELFIDLPWSALSAYAGNAEARIYGLVSQPGFKPHACLIPIPDKLPPTGEVIDLVVLPIPGAKVRGVVVDAHGQPVPATLNAEGINSDGNWQASGYHKTETGTFELDVRLGGTTWITALAEEGSAALGPIEIDMTAPPDDLRLVLTGPGVVQGKVTDEDGRPAAALELLALTEAGHANGLFANPRQELTRKLDREGLGAYWRLATTNVRGEFKFSGLRDDRFVVLAKTERYGSYDILLSETAVQSDGQEQSFELRRPYLAVRVLDYQGSLVPAHPIEIKNYLDQDISPAWPRRVSVQLTRPPSGDTPPDAWNFVRRGKALADGTLVFELPDRGDWLLTLLAPKRPPQTMLITIAPDSGRVEHAFTLGEALSEGKLKVTVLSPDGKPVRNDLCIRVLDPASQSCLLEKRNFYHFGRETWPATFQLPVGEYDLFVESISSHDSYHGTLMDPRAYGESRSSFAIRSEEDTEVTVRLNAGAYLDLLVNGTFSEADRLALLEAGGWQLERATTILQPENGYPKWAKFKYYLEGSSAQGTHLFNSCALNVRERSEIIPPGKYRLTVSLPGGRSQTRDIVLADGQVLPVTLDFEDE